MNRVLIVDDEENLRATLVTTFRLAGFETATAASGEEALTLLGASPVDLVLLDLQMPGLDGIETLRRMRDGGFEQPVIFLSAHGTIERAIEAVRMGAYDFLEKPPHADRLLVTARRALRESQRPAASPAASGAPRQSSSGPVLVGAARPMLDLEEQIERVARTNVRVLITGENGTGKELVAQSIHHRSNREDQPFVALNCSAVPRELFESELFGHEKGAFTGATRARPGRFRRASGGTLFLDEVGEMPLELQPKLLRVLETGVVEPLGADREAVVDVRVLAATNRDLEPLVRGGAFREDLFYRLAVVTLRVPALRDRKQDIPALVELFARRATEEHGVKRVFSDAALERLATHDYPGNVRELRNLVERLVVLGNRETVEPDEVDGAIGSTEVASEIDEDAPLRDRLAAHERRIVEETLKRHDWRIASAARDLGLERSHLYKKLKALGIEKPERS